MNEQRTPEEWFRISEFERRPMPVTLERFTDDTVWIKGGRRLKRMSSYEGFFRTQKEAWDWVIAKAIARRDRAQLELSREQDRLERLRQDMGATK